MALRASSSTGFATRRPEEKSRRSFWLKVGLVLFLSALLAAGTWYTRRAGFFNVVRVESGSYRFTRKADLDLILGQFLGRNIWTLSQHEVADSLATLPWVRDLRIFKRLPGTLEVDFREWHPLLSLEGSGERTGTRVLVDDGRVLVFPDQLPVPALPVLVGVPCVRDSSMGARRLAEPWNTEVLSLLEAMAATGLEKSGPVDFLVARPEGFAIVLQGNRGRLLVGREDFTDRLARFMAARHHLEPGLQMDLRFRDRITCSRL